MTAATNQLLMQIDSILDFYTVNEFKFRESTDEGVSLATQFNARAVACIERIAGSDSAYANHSRAILASPDFPSGWANRINGVLSGLRTDVAGGYLIRLGELVHADLFSDYIEQAEYLLYEGFKDPAAVLAGGTLESHLRQLCMKHSIPFEEQTPRGMQPKKAETMNADLAKAGVYSKLEQKQVTAWLDLRNKAAHARYNEYTKEQVALFLQGLKDFILRFPA